MKKNITTVVEITDKHLKLLQMMPSKGAITVLSADAKDISSHLDADIPKVLSGMVSTLKIKPQHFIGVIPRRLVMLRHFSLPSHSQEEIEKMISLQVVKQVPYSKEDIIFDSVILDKEPSGYAKVLAIIAHKDVVNKYLKLFADAHIHLHQLTLSSAGLLNWYLYQEEKSYEKNAAPIAVINVDCVHTEIVFCYRQKLLFSRSINYGAKDISGENLSAFLQDLNLTIETYVKEHVGADIQKIILTPQLPSVALLKEKLEAQHSLAVEVVDAFRGVTWKKDSSYTGLFEKDGVAMTVGIGLGLSSAKLINLLPHEVKHSRETDRRKKEGLKTLGLLFLILILGLSAFGMKTYKYSAHLNRLERHIRETESVAQETAKKIEQVAFMKQRLNPVFSSVDIIDKIYDATPEGVAYNVIHIKENGSLTLQGVSDVGAGVNTLQSNLLHSSLFQNVTLQYATKKKIFKGELTDFKITCQLSEVE